MDHDENNDFGLDGNQTARLVEFLSEMPDGVIGEHLTEAQLSAYAAGDPAPASAVGIDQHLASCEVCARRLEWFLSFRGAMSEEANRRRHVASTWRSVAPRDVREDPVYRAEDRFISEATLEALRSGYGQEEKFKLLFEDCLSWVRGKGSLSLDVYTDIVSEAIADELDALRLSELNAAEASKRLLRALGRHRRQKIRALRPERFPNLVAGDVASSSRSVELKDFNTALVAFDSAEEKIGASHAIELARLLKGFISLSLDSLSDRDYALLYERYNLQAYGIKPRERIVPLNTLTPGARRTALSRARVHLLNELERRLSEAGTCLDEDRLVVRDALRLIRSGRVLRTGRK